MKRLLLFIGVVFILAAAAVAVFIATFNADLYRPLLVNKLQEALGVPVKLERISLGWRGGIALSLKKLAVYPEPKGIYADLSRRAEPSVQIEEISLLVRPLPLLKKRLEIASVALIQPRVHLSRGAGGAFQVEGVNLPGISRPNGLEMTEAVASQSASAASPSASAASQPGPAPSNSPTAVSLSIDRVQVEQGTVRVSDSSLKPPGEWILEQVALEAVVKPDRIDLRNFSAEIGGGKITVSGKAEGLKSQPRVEFNAAADGLALQKFLPASEGEPHLSGELSASFQGTVQGSTPDAMLSSLSGNGKVRIAHPVLVNLNILREVFSRISIVPGLEEVLQSRLPESYRDKLNSRDTVFEPIDLPVTAAQGALQFQNLRLATDTFVLTGAGRLGMDRALSSRMQLKIGPELSAAILRSAKEFQALAGPDGRIEFPVMAEGILPRVTVLPDVSYLASHLIVHRAEDLLGGLLEKMLEKSSK
ncbi:MAG: AsmA family protein [Candidatus Omnitrophica bacterium]|nr:AsmA family protein [Candidatus Omnitrophota bacterium]